MPTPDPLDAPHGFTLAAYDHNHDCRLRGTVRPCWVRHVGEVVHIIPIRKDGDWSGLFYVRPPSFLRAVAEQETPT